MSWKSYPIQHPHFCTFYFHSVNRIWACNPFAESVRQDTKNRSTKYWAEKSASGRTRTYNPSVNSRTENDKSLSFFLLYVIAFIRFSCDLFVILVSWIDLYFLCDPDQRLKNQLTCSDTLKNILHVCYSLSGITNWNLAASQCRRSTFNVCL